jgi:hypothetical protein
MMKKPSQAGSSPGKRTTLSSTTRTAPLTEDEIDERVIAEADDDSAWDPPIYVTPKKAAIGLPATLARRAARVTKLS